MKSDREAANDAYADAMRGEWTAVKVEEPLKSPLSSDEKPKEAPRVNPALLQQRNGGR